MSKRPPREDYLIDQLDRSLALDTLDGTEGYAVLEEFANAVGGPNGDPVRVYSALGHAKRRLSALMVGLVPREAVNDAVCSIMENIP